jgi:O-antigen ligase
VSPRTWTVGDDLVPAAVAAATVVLLVRDQGGYFAPSWGWSALALFGVVVTWLVASGRTDAGRPDVVFLVALLALTLWVGLSIAWSVNRAQSVLELERALVLLSGCAAFLVLARRRGFDAVLPALLLGITGICAYSLSARVAPAAGSFHPDQPVTGYRLFEPVGYWNGLGLFAVLGILLALGLVTEPTARIELRILASISLTVLPVTLFFTFSRGAWLALVMGLIAALASSPHRLRLIAETAVFAVLPAVSVILAWRAGALTHQSATLAAATRAGHRLALELLVLALATIPVVFLVRRLEKTIRVGATTRRVAAVAGAAVVLAGLAVGIARGGGPVSIVSHAYHSFADPVPPREQGDLTSRLASLNGNGRARMWEVAIDSLHGRGWAIGSGAGSFERNWDGSKRADEVVRDAHGLYVETLSELGAIGLLLLVAVLATPLVVGLRRRRTTPLVPAVAGAYAAFLIHLAVDWDWELSGVALTGLFVGCLLLVAHRDGGERLLGLPLRTAGTAVGIAAAAFAFVGLVGNTALARAQTANRDHRSAAAAAAATTAHRWMFWSPAPLLALGTARFERGDTGGARASFREAISLDPDNWQSWLDLAASVHGSARRHAVARARELYPRSPQVVEFEKQQSP